MPASPAMPLVVSALSSEAMMRKVLRIERRKHRDHRLPHYVCPIYCFSEQERHAWFRSWGTQLIYPDVDWKTENEEFVLFGSLCLHSLNTNGYMHNVQQKRDDSLR